MSKSTFGVKELKERKDECILYLMTAGDKFRKGEKIPRSAKKQIMRLIG